MASKTVEAPTISCTHCVHAIVSELEDLAGVTAVRADASTKKVTVEWDETETDWGEIRRLLEEIGYAPVER